ncbi:peptide/nickel transport system ATP-binding protein [Nonomuraea solani]|uniref:Peptide/nickel transport system ATP-binding protein n=1 Tax=Nonomuraea solani TaxID=1144553 RepID=A0A1H6EMA5_9ACTN|nr:ATP-binding cassette domain-containing protein [Nonomuraea solani]SEG98136.1 peptide/nickel transport system ATP-binding protein [Nonomuraea solani]
MILKVSGLRAEVDGRALVDGVSLELAAGEVLALVGASGSGKTTTGLALLGEHAPGVRVTGEIHLAPGAVAYVPQHPSTVLNPARRVGGVLREIARAAGRAGELARVVERARLPKELLGRYPHQLSGGQQQRVVLAQALLLDPVLIVADEPTTGQDGLIRAEVIEEFRGLRAQGIALVLLSHDLAMVRALADRVAVLHEGRVVESGPAATVLDAPRHEYTRRLLATRLTPRTATASVPALLEVRELVAGHRRAPVLNGVSLQAGAGECVAVVGRSGGGKTTLARCVAGLHRPVSGTVALDGRPLPRHLPTRAREVQYVFQDARASFDPYRGVAAQVARTAVRLRGTRPDEAAARAREMLDRVGLDERTSERRPAALSGGELQRAALARALLAEPKVLICDEITSGLDALVQAAILDLLDELRRDLGLTLLLISHDMDVVARSADRVLALDGGRIESERTP